jgi:hypothetical protein
VKLVEAEADGPIEGDDALITPPRPPHRRVSISLLVTLTVLIGTVVTIYTVFPARHQFLLTEAIERHREPQPQWDLVAPSPLQLRVWALGVISEDVPLPTSEVTILGARRIDVLDRRAALIGLQIDGEPVTYLVQHANGIAPEHSERVDGDLRAVAWQHGAFMRVAVGRDSTSAKWLRAFGQ